MLTFHKHLSSPQIFSEVRVTRSLILLSGHVVGGGVHSHVACEGVSGHVVGGGVSGHVECGRVSGHVTGGGVSGYVVCRGLSGQVYMRLV